MLLYFPGVCLTNPLFTESLRGLSLNTHYAVLIDSGAKFIYFYEWWDLYIYIYIIKYGSKISSIFNFRSIYKKIFLVTQTINEEKEIWNFLISFAQVSLLYHKRIFIAIDNYKVQNIIQFIFFYNTLKNLKSVIFHCGFISSVHSNDISLTKYANLTKTLNINLTCQIFLSIL